MKNIQRTLKSMNFLPSSIDREYYGNLSSFANCQFAQAYGDILFHASSMQDRYTFRIIRSK